LFFSLLKECLDRGVISEQQIRDEMRANHLRHDALEMTRQALPLDAVLGEVRLAA
jgi:hypothetical protein